MISYIIPSTVIVINGNSWGVVGCPGTRAGKGVASEVGTNFQYWVGKVQGPSDLKGSEMAVNYSVTLAPS